MQNVFGIIYIVAALSFASSQMSDSSSPNPTNASIEMQFLGSIWTLNSNVFRQSFQPSNGDKCLQSMSQLTNDIRSFKLYALHLADSWGRVESGFYQVNQRWMGRYFECKDVESDLFEGEYFLADFKLPVTDPLQVQVGTCFPNTCTEENVTTILKDLVLPNATLAVAKSRQFNPSSADSIVGLTILVLVFAMMLGATVYDFIMRQRAHTEQAPKWQQIILSFSAIDNTSKLLNTDGRASDITCLHGIRFISMTWIILGHTVLYINYYSDNLIFISRYAVNSLPFQAVMNATFSVDTFFLLSGLLVSYLGMRELQRSDGKVKVLVMYLYRYIRLTPAFAFAIVISVGVFPLFGTGPLWYMQVAPKVSQCQQHWYTSLLYLSNLYPGDINKECFNGEWYLDNDMQFFLLAPLYLYLLHRRFKVALGVLGGLTAFSIILNGALSGLTMQQPNALELASLPYYFLKAAQGGNVDLSVLSPLAEGAPSLGILHLYITDIYTKPWFRMGPYLIGVMFGYLLFAKKNEVKMKRALVICGWITAFVVNMLIVYGLFPTIHSQQYLSVGLAAFYNALARPLFSLGIGWVVIACTSGYGGFVNDFLSWKLFIPLSRLTYCMFLVHAMVIQWLSHTSETLWHVNIQFIISLFCGTLCLSTLFAYLMHLLVEAPFVRLIKLLTKKDQSKQQQRTSTQLQANETQQNESPLMEMEESNQNGSRK